MDPKRFALVLMMCLSLVSTTFGQAQPAQADDNKIAKNLSHEPRAANGKKLLTAVDLMKINAVSAPRISPDGARVAYTVGETRMEKDKEWKGVTQVWEVPAGGGKARQYTRGEKNSSAPEWP